MVTRNRDALNAARLLPPSGNCSAWWRADFGCGKLTAHPEAIFPVAVRKSASRRLRVT